jgi:endonuclease YncB( thermonuclease family)
MFIMKQNMPRLIATIISIIVIILPTSVLAGSYNKTYGNATVLEVVSVYDGDTFKANIQGFPAIIGEKISIRIYGIDAPELKNKDSRIRELAQKAKQFTAERLRKGTVITLKNIRRGKYFRIVAEVYIDGVNLGEELIKAGLALPYYGGKKPVWKDYTFSNSAQSLPR